MVETAANGAPDPALGGIRRLALHARHEAAGARFAPFAGWGMPLQYEGIVAEHEAVRRDVGVFDVSHLGRAWLTGPAAGARLRSVTTFDVTMLVPGTAHYSLYCNEAGGIEDDIFVYRVGEERWLIAHNAAGAEADFARLAAACADGQGVAATEVTHSSVMLAVQGPRAIELLSNVLGVPCADVPPRGCMEVAWGGTDIVFVRTGYTGEDGGECVVPVTQAASFWDAVLAAGARPVGLGARDTLRLEAALPLHGHEIDASTEPYTAGLGFAVTLEDGAPFTGRAALAALAEQPRTRRLVCIRADGRGGVFRGGMAVHAAAAPGDGAIGLLTSGAFSPSLRTSIGMAYLPLEFAAPGTPLTVDVRGRAEAAQVVRRPFVRGSAYRRA